jgi:hypothetical protein
VFFSADSSCVSVVMVICFLRFRPHLLLRPCRCKFRSHNNSRNLRSIRYATLCIVGLCPRIFALLRSHGKSSFSWLCSWLLFSIVFSHSV